jgi:outer membrane biogenesis lipoprotein LolB
LSAIAGWNKGHNVDMTRTFFLLAALCAIVAACTTSPEQQTARDDERCTARGYKPQTKQHDDCVQGLAASRDVREQQRHRELVERPAPTYGPGPR